MGCDFEWSAAEADIFRQRKTGWFLESLFDADETGASAYLKGKWNCLTFQGDYSGYFLDVGKRWENARPATLKLIGTTLYYGDLSEIPDGVNCHAARQLSFVFINPPQLPNTGFINPELVTVEIISDLSKPKYDRFREFFRDGEDNDPNLLKAIYQRRGFDRLIGGESWLALLLYSIRKQFLPKLKVTDDYLYYQSLARSAPLVPADFSESICKPALAEKWGFDYLNLQTGDLV